jgi:hypothetical protein
MNEEQIADIWTVFKEYIEKKNLDIAAEKFVDTLADYGVSDETFASVLGVDGTLDDAINYYLDFDTDEDDSDEEDY